MYSHRLFCVWMFVLSQVLFRMSGECRSGWFVDNGIGQTVLDDQLPRVEVGDMKYEILDLLGISEQPQLDLLSAARRKAVPKFLLKIYQQLRKEDVELNHEGNIDDGMYVKPRRRRSIDEYDGIEITDENAKLIEESDFILTFLNNRNALPTFGHDNRTHLSFDLSEFSPNATQLLMSELYLFKRRLPNIHVDFKACVITLYAIKVVDGTSALQPIHLTYTEPNYEGWIRINFTETLNDWLTKTWVHNLLYITIDFEIETGILEASSVDTNYLLSVWDEEHQPFVTAFFKNENILRKQAPKPSRRIKRSPYRPVSIPVNPLIDKNMHARQGQACSKYMLYVSFRDLNYDWIIAPEGYEAFYCAGQCGFPAPHNVSYTNHAIVQTLANLMISSSIPKPCCAPMKLGSITVLYELKETQFHLKKYNNMFAKHCGCQ